MSNASDHEQNARASTELQIARSDIPKTQHTDSEDSIITKKRDTLIPTPECCETPKCKKCWKVTKYVYVIGVIVFGFTLAALQQISDPIDDWLDAQQIVILEFLIHDSWLYIVLVIVAITFCKSIGVKDILGLREISVIIIAYRICAYPPVVTFFIAMFINGILSSISKLIEYQVIGYELQVVQGTPVQYIFRFMRAAFMKCCKCARDEPSNIEWLDSKWTFLISEESRKSKHKRSMDIMRNIESVVFDVHANGCCREIDRVHTDRTEEDVKHDENDKTAQAQEKEVEEEEVKECSMRCALWKVLCFVVAVLWTSMIEWVQPLKELFLYAHNWDLTLLKAVIIVLSEFADIDKMVETWMLIEALNHDQDIITAKVGITVSKFVFWTLGYCFILPPTLFWAYRYCQIHDDRVSVCE